jgi:transcriptional regulator with XRE-family HTH domain
MSDINDLATRTGYGLHRLARLLGVDKATVQRWRGGATPNDAASQKIRQLLHLTDSELETVCEMLTRIPGRTAPRLGDDNHPI